jgi:hypothetical protein
MPFPVPAKTCENAVRQASRCGLCHVGNVWHVTFSLQTWLPDNQHSQSRAASGVLEKFGGHAETRSLTPDRRQLAPASKLLVLWRFACLILGGHVREVDSQTTPPESP